MNRGGGEECGRGRYLEPKMGNEPGVAVREDIYIEHDRRNK